VKLALQLKRCLLACTASTVQLYGICAGIQKLFCLICCWVSYSVKEEHIFYDPALSACFGLKSRKQELPHLGLLKVDVKFIERKRG
jgi:hypothetical protein